MNIDAKTINVLKNFATINPSIFVKPGNVLETISVSKTIKVTATVPTEFPKQFAIYNLNKFISVLSLFTNPELDFKDIYVRISDKNNRSTKIVYADESTVIKVPEKQIKLPSVDVSVKVSVDNFKDIEKALGVLQLPEIMLVGDGTKVSLQAVDSKNPTGDIFSVDVGETKKTFKAIFKAENIKTLSGDYQINICEKGISQFIGDNIEYFIAVEANSEF